MFNKAEIEKAKIEVKAAQEDVNRIKKAIKQAEGSNFKESIITKAEKGITFLCAGSHLALKYAMDKVENTEAFVKKYAYGQEYNDVIRDRQKATITTQLEITRSLKALKGRLSEFSFSSEEADILNNTGTINTPV